MNPEGDERLVPSAVGMPRWIDGGAAVSTTKATQNVLGREGGAVFGVLPPRQALPNIRRATLPMNHLEADRVGVDCTAGANHVTPLRTLAPRKF